MIAVATDLTTYDVAARLCEFWGWAGKETSDGFLEKMTLKHLAVLLGPSMAFWEAFAETDWLIVEEGGLRLRNADRWILGATKARLIARRDSRERKRRQRENSGSEDDPEPDRDRDNDVTKVGQSADSAGHSRDNDRDNDPHERDDQRDNLLRSRSRSHSASNEPKREKVRSTPNERRGRGSGFGPKGLGRFSVRQDDLEDTGKLLVLFGTAVKAGFVTASEADRLKFVAAAERTRSEKRDNPCAFFAGFVRKGHWGNLSQADEEAARRRLAKYRDEGEAPLGRLG